MGQAVAVLCAHGLAALWHVWRRVWRPGAKLGVRCPLTTPHATIFHRSPTSVKRVARSWPPSPITSCRAYSHQTRSSPRTTASGECRHTYHFQRPTFNKILFKPVSRFSSASHPPLISSASHPFRSFINRGVATRMGIILVAGKFWGDDIVLHSELLRDRVPAVTVSKRAKQSNAQHATPSAQRPVPNAQCPTPDVTPSATFLTHHRPRHSPAHSTHSARSSSLTRRFCPCRVWCSWASPPSSPGSRG